jgi:thioredoxin reductase (NADPH)
MKEVIIIGNGPAGISASLYTARAGIKTTVIGKDGGALMKADKIENYYGFENPVSGEQLISAGIAQSKRLGVEMINSEVVSIGYDGKLTVKTINGEYKADSVILATGANRIVPKIAGIDTYEGRGISYCAVCDGFFYRGKDVAVLGSGEYALAEAMELLPIVKSVTIITDGKELTAKIPDSIHIITKEIENFSGSNSFEKIFFKDGTSLSVSGVFVALGTAGSTDFAKKLGAETNGKNIVVDEKMATNVPGLYAAGDCTGGMYQIAKAVYEGAKAGTEVVKYLKTISSSSTLFR